MAILEVPLTFEVLILNYLKRLNQTTLNKINFCLSISGIQRRSSEQILGTTSDLLEWMIFVTYYFSKIFWFILNFVRCFLSRQCYDYKDLAVERFCVWCSHFELLYKIYFDMWRYVVFVNAEWISTTKIHRSRNCIVISARSLWHSPKNQ